MFLGLRFGMNILLLWYSLPNANKQLIISHSIVLSITTFIILLTRNMENNTNTIDQPSTPNENNDEISSKIKNNQSDRIDEDSPLLSEINRLTQMSYELKQKGDEELKMENFEEAYKNYTKAVITVKELFQQNKQSNDDLTKIVNDILVKANSNMCYIDIKKLDWINLLRHANKVLHYDKSNIKGRYRRCLAYIHLGKYEKADEDLFELEDLIGGTKELEELETLFESKKTKEANEDGLIYKKMSKKLRNPELISAKEKIEQKQKKTNNLLSVINGIYTNCIQYICSMCRKRKNKEQTH